MKVINIGYSLLVILSIVNLYRMARYYLLAPPDKWLEGTKGALNNLNGSHYAAIMMYIHWIMGFIITILSIFQILPFFRRPKYLHYHRLMGDVYCFACLITSIAGNIYIYINGTVGKLNMNLAFSVYGWWMFYLSISTYYYGRKYRLTHNISHYTLHYRSAIRLWTLGIAGLNYRLTYLILMIFGYHVNSPHDFSRLIDMIMVWEFFIGPMIITEIYLFFKK